MSKIYKALRKLQDQGPSGDRGATGAGSKKTRRTPGSAIPIAPKKGIPIDGPKEHVDEKNLIRRGLLAPWIRQSRSLTNFDASRGR